MHCGLHDLDQGGRFQNPADLEDPYITKFRTSRRFPRAARTVLEGVAAQKGEWLAARKLIGFQSLGPKKFIDDLHELTASLFDPTTKSYNFANGALLKWTVATYAVSEGQLWLCQKTADTSKKIDPETGKLYEYTAYWLDKGIFDPLVAPGGPGPLIGGPITRPGKGSLNLQGLKGAWGAKII